MSDEELHLLAHLQDCIQQAETHVDHEARRLRDQRRDAVKAMQAAGWSLERIGAKVGRKKQTIAQWLR